MGWWSALGNRISGAVHSLGSKAASVVKRGRKFVHDHAGQIERISKVVGDVAPELARQAMQQEQQPQ